MQKLAIMSAMAAIMFAACNNSPEKSGSMTEANAKYSDSAVQSAASSEPKSSPSIKEVTDEYINVKNALAKDNGNEAAKAGQRLTDAIDKIDKSQLTDQKKKAFEDIAPDIKENAEHIKDNAGKIAHQREHFEMLSKDMYDLVKSFGPEETLYKDFCPMYNDGKGATWLSETKDIKNPYLGQKMSTCGEVKEEIKK